MRRLIFIAIAVMFVAGWSSADESYNLPELHVIKTVALSPSYGCRPAEEFQKGYMGTALFLSDYSRRRNSPDLLFNGACESQDYFDVSTAGDDMALIADLGTGLSVEKITAHSAFNVKGALPHFTKFERIVKVAKDHTYAVLVNKREIRGLYVFTVVDYVPNKRVGLRYAVKEYQIMSVKAASAGFDWEKESYEKVEAKTN